MPDTSHAPVVKKRDKILVYFLAATEDQQECAAIKKYLAPALRNSAIPIEISSDFEIPAGEDRDKYKQRLYAADIVLAFISADFIDDEETYQRTKKVIARYNNNETIMLPILVRNCLWKSTPFANLPLLPKNFQPLNNKQFWNSEDDALTSVVSDIYESINAFSEYAEIHHPAAAETKMTPESAIDQPANRISPQIKTENNFQQTNRLADLQRPAVRPVSAATSKIPLDENWRTQYYKDVLGKRAAAFFLDNLITMIPVMFIAFIIASVALVNQGEEVSEEKVDVILLFALSVYFIVCAAMESSKWRGTFGKQIMKLQITDRDGRPISFFRALWRNIVRWVVGYSYLLIFPLIIQYFTFKKSRQLFHDQLSNTLIGEKIKK
ncbi:MAG: RDD family protein [Bacteroidota bacterium]|nr:RDD family protein [Bacteroidota bacterium]MDQ6889400.1 RDD family protein [Bacteroidota bacterium]